MDMTSKNDIMYIKLLNHKLDVDSKFGFKRTKPLRDNMEVTPNEYREFLSTLSYTLNHIKTWLNQNQFKKGLRFPYNLTEFDTEVSFREKSMHVLLEVEQNAAEFFEEELW